VLKNFNLPGNHGATYETFIVFCCGIFFSFSVLAGPAAVWYAENNRCAKAFILILGQMPRCNFWSTDEKKAASLIGAALLIKPMRSWGAKIGIRGALTLRTIMGILYIKYIGNFNE